MLHASHSDSRNPPRGSSPLDGDDASACDGSLFDWRQIRMARCTIDERFDEASDDVSSPHFCELPGATPGHFNGERRSLARSDSHRGWLEPASRSSLSDTTGAPGTRHRRGASNMSGRLHLFGNVTRQMTIGNSARATLRNDGSPRAQEIARVFKCHKRNCCRLWLDTCLRILKLSRSGKPLG